MEAPRGSVRVLQQDINGVSQVSKENGVVQVSDEQRNQLNDGSRVEASFPSTTSASLTESPVDISTDYAGAESSANPAAESIPEKGEVASVLSVDDTTDSAAPRKTQSVEHISWMERRIGTLEEELRSLRTETL